MRRLSRVLLLVALLVGALGYPLSYALLRASHSFVHGAFFTSSEGYDAHVFHTIEGHPEHQLVFTPLISAELWFWERWPD